MIPDEAVEAAAKAFIEHGTLLPALEAAAPHVASAWHDADSAAYVDGALSAAQANVMYNASPYRSQS